MSTAQLRLILLIIGVIFIGALAWWERRRPRQANTGGAERSAPRDFGGDAPRATREPAFTLPTMRARDPSPEQGLPVVEMATVSAHAPVLAAPPEARSR